MKQLSAATAQTWAMAAEVHRQMGYESGEVDLWALLEELKVVSLQDCQTLAL